MHENKQVATLGGIKAPHARETFAHGLIQRLVGI